MKNRNYGISRNPHKNRTKWLECTDSALKSWDFKKTAGYPFKMAVMYDFSLKEAPST